MTYKQLTNRIEDIDMQIQFIKNITDDLSDKEDIFICGNIINNLCAYKNHLMYNVEYTEK